MRQHESAGPERSAGRRLQAGQKKMANDHARGNDANWSGLCGASRLARIRRAVSGGVGARAAGGIRRARRHRYKQLTEIPVGDIQFRVLDADID